MLDQSPHQLARAEAKPALARAAKVLGDAEDLPFPTDHFDRYVSAGSIEYWPEPQRAIAEAYRVLRPEGRAALIGPVRPGHPLAARGWPRRGCCSPPRRSTATGSPPPASPTSRSRRSRRTGTAARAGPTPSWSPGASRRPGPSPLPLGPLRDTARAPAGPAERARFALRFAVGSLAGALFLPLGAALALRHRLRARSAP